jgi:hypothetical protein
MLATSFWGGGLFRPPHIKGESGATEVISRRNTVFALAAMAILPAFDAVEAAGKGGGKGSSPGNGVSGKGSSPGAGPSGKAKSEGAGLAAGGKAKGKAKGIADTVQPSVELDSIQGLGTASYRVRHRNGFQEILKGGRYRMLDDRGRTIVDRAAKPGDYVRLRAFGGG